jgi:quercetin dioxygenase-like cupin family protein
MDFPPGYQTVKGYAEIAKGSCSGRHTHPGIETSYILEGEGVLKIDGQPDQHVKAGDPIQIPAGVVHDGCATTSVMKVLTVHVVEKGKPLGSPAP